MSIVTWREYAAESWLTPAPQLLLSYLKFYTQRKNLPGWTATNTWLAPVTSAQSRMQDKRQLNISVNRVMLKQEVWLAVIIEPFILVLDSLG